MECSPRTHNDARCTADVQTCEREPFTGGGVRSPSHNAIVHGVVDLQELARSSRLIADHEILSCVQCTRVAYMCEYAVLFIRACERE